MNLLFIGIGFGVFIVALISMYRQVSPSEAHVVVRPNSKFVVCTDDKVEGFSGSNWYMYIPFITNVRELDVTIKELKHSQQTFEKNLARFITNWSLKFHIHDPLVASSKYINDAELSEQLVSVVEAGVNAVCSKYDIADLRSKKKDIESDIKESIEENLNSWGVSLMNFQVVDFQDTKESKVITDLSLMREMEISSNTRQRNAEQKKEAEVKEAQALEVSATRKIQAEEAIGKREQDKKMTIAVQEQLAKEKEFAVIRTATLAQVNIDKEKQVVESERLKIEGEGYRLLEEEKAKGDAAKIREMGLAEADAKDKLSAALKKFDEAALKALVAEKVVEKDKAIGVATAEALQKANLNVFSGGKAGEEGFNLAQYINSLGVSSPEGKLAFYDRLSTPNAIVHNSKDTSKPVKN